MIEPTQDWDRRWQNPDSTQTPSPDWPVSKWHWNDPDPNSRGMLAADRIRYYQKELGMIRPFCEKQVKPASYDLTLGPRYQIEGRDDLLTDGSPWLVIPKNSIAFVTMRERLMLPHYIAARFNLSIDLIYQGLLLGTGPQVDPGYKGVLSCPLHNISNNPIRIRLGQPFAKIDFVKTTGLGENAKEKLAGVQNEDDLYKLEDEKAILGYENNRNVLFNRRKCWKEPVFGYAPGMMRVSSSVAPLARTISKWRWGALIGFLVFITITISLIGMGSQLLGRCSDADKDYRTVTDEVTKVQAALQRIEKELAAVRSETGGLRDRGRRQAPQQTQESAEAEE